MKKYIESIIYERPRVHDSIDRLRRDSKTAAFTLIELIVVMAVIGILVLLAAPKFLGYTQKAEDTKYIHTAKVIETTLEAYLINGGAFPDNLEVVEQIYLEESVANNSLISVEGYMTSIDDETYYELTYDFINNYLDIKISAQIKEKLFFEVEASKDKNIPSAIYASSKGLTLIDKGKTLKGYTSSASEPIAEAPVSKLYIKEFLFPTSFGYRILLTNDNALYVWGNNIRGSLGLGDTTVRTNPVENTYFKDRDIILKEIYTNNSVYAIDTEGNAYSWGYNQFGEAGHGHTNIITTPQKIALPSGEVAREMFFGSIVSFILTEQGNVYGFGRSTYGQTGTGTTTDRTSPVKLSIPEPVKEIFPVSSTFFAKTVSGKIYTWGSNSIGNTGTGLSASIISSPVILNTLSDKDIISIRMKYNSYFAKANNGDVYVWGNNDNGQLGLGNFISSKIPLKNELLSQLRFSQLVNTGLKSMVMVSETNQLYVWGQNDAYNLGLGHTNHINTPTLHDYFKDKSVKQVFQSGNYSFALTDDGKLYGFGTGIHGYLGQGVAQSIFKTPALISDFNGEKVKNIHNDSSWIVIAETIEGNLYSWGDGVTRIGAGSIINTFTPHKVQIPTNQGFDRVISSPFQNSIAVTADYKFYEWGENPTLITFPENFKPE